MTTSSDATAPGTTADATPATSTAPLPEGTRLIHVGPHKTGTTSIQGAMWTARAELLRQGVRLAGRSANPAAAARAVTGRPTPYADDGSTPKAAHWEQLRRQITTATEPRVVVSSEMFAWAQPDVVRRIVDELDAERVHVAITLRPIAKVMPSLWQQDVQAGIVTPFDDWVRGALETPPSNETKGFWFLQRHDELVRRWADVVGPDRVTAVVVDERDHGFLMRTFESLLGLREGTLVPQRDTMNRSLTWPEAEAVRAFNEQFWAQHLTRGLHARLLRFGAAQQMKRRDPSPDEAKIVLPAWAAEPVTTIQREIVGGIRASGVRVIGDLDRLTDAPDTAAAPGPAGIAVAPEIAAALAIGIVVASGEARRAKGPGGRFQLAEHVDLVRVPTYQVAGALVMRGLRTGVRGLDSVRRRIRR